MSISVIEAGLQTTIQAAARRSQRHFGVPASGAADPLSLALANRLVGNDLLAPALEASLIGPTLCFEKATAFALTGGTAKASLRGEDVEFHTTIFARAGDELRVGSVEVAARVYIAVAGGLRADNVLGSKSTYMPAGFGGHQGRALVAGDTLIVEVESEISEGIETPEGFRPPITSRWAVRACRSAETHLLLDKQRGALFDTNWTIGRRADRMGMQMDGPRIKVSSDGRLPSAAVFPGTIQCPEDGVPFILGVDSGTTGGYPRIAQIARADRHLLGQMRPGDHVHFMPRQPQEAIDELQAKHDYWREWLPEIERVI